MIFDIRFDVKIEKRESFDATIERETISAQNIDFFDVSIDAISDCFDVVNDVNENENFVIDSEELIDDVNIETDSLDENVANDVDIAIIAFDDLIDSTDDCFDVKKEINIAIIAFDVNFAYSLDVVIAIIANIAFDADSTISFRNEVENAMFLID